MYPVVVKDSQGGHYDIVVWGPDDVDVLFVFLVLVCLMLLLFLLRLMQ
uniref:Early protein E5 beta n=1 Tax=human papillomavirus 71 TaxID=120686 RepID=A0A6H0EZQ1_9PAPI|nr:early protein E5 beta [human papillomavirus 71]